MRRDKEDVKWKNCKKQVFEWDKGQCLLCQCMTVQEAMIFEKNKSGFSTSKIDPAHYRPASQNYELLYDPTNVYSVCRSHHEALDHGRDPITGDFCTPDVTEKYWQRIIAKRKENLGQKTVDLPDLFYSEGKENSEAGTSELNFDGLFYDEL